jgi:hypothetical protein
MPRPIDYAPPGQASSNVPTEAQLPDMMPLPDPEGAPSASAPAFFEPLDPPPAEADVGIDMAMDHVPSVVDFFDVI